MARARMDAVLKRLQIDRLAGRELVQGLILALTIAAAASFLSDHYGAPAMLFALLIGMAFNFLATNSGCTAGLDFASKTVLRLGVALLGVRLTVSDMAALGWMPVLGVIGLVALTIGAGLVIAPALGRRWRFGLLTGGAVAICGASAAMAIAAVIPSDKRIERDTLFTVVAVTSLSTVAMIAYPILFKAIGATDTEIGFLIGVTIHDVAQVVGAGFSVSETAGNIATFVKLQRVALLPVVLLAIILLTRRAGGGNARLPWFVIAFVVLVGINSAGLIADPVRDITADASRWMLVTAIAALGVKTSLKAMVDVGPRHAGVVVLETLLLLLAAIGFLTVWRVLG
ncbi:MAG: YeiH family protein [Inquilinaceae bacterium]